MTTLDTVSVVAARQELRFFIRLRKSCSFHVLLGVLLLAANFVIARAFRIEPDTWWHIKLGDSILATWHWPKVDTWSFTVHGISRVAYEWGGEVILALAWRLGGLQGMQALLIALTSALVLLIYYYTYLRCGDSKAAFLGSLAVFPMAAMCFSLRPQLLGYIFLFVTLICLERFRLGLQKTLWVLPPLFLVWINTHGSFTLGFMALGLYFFSGLRDFSWDGLRGERWSNSQRFHMELVSLLSLATLPLTPYGARLAFIPFDVAFSLPLSFRYVTEWQPLNTGFWEAKLLLVLLLAFLLAQITLRPRYRLEEIALYFFVTYAVFTHLRFVILYAAVFAPLAASLLLRWVPPYRAEIDKYVLNAALIVGMVLACAKYYPSLNELSKKISAEHPVEAVQYLRGHRVPEPMFNEYNFGGYLVWSRAPEHKVFIDGRGDVFEEAGVFSDYLRIVELKPDALAILRRYGIRSCLIRKESALATFLAERPDWKRVYADKLSAIFVRQPQSEGELKH